MSICVYVCLWVSLGVEMLYTTFMYVHFCLMWYNLWVVNMVFNNKGEKEMDMFQKMAKMPPVAEIAYRTYCINEYGLDAMFLIVGDERALLIDTGTGVFNLPDLLNQLTDKPITVALTHGHVDHAGACGWFEEIWLHPADFEMASSIPYDQRKGYAGMLSMNPTAQITPDDTVRFDKFPKMRALGGGDVIDLGGRKIVVYETPGHTPGGMSFLDVGERIIFTGDACNINTLLMGGGDPKEALETLRGTAELLVSLQPFYDRNYNGHIGYGGFGMVVPQGYSVAQDMVDLCRDILAGKEEGEESEMKISGVPALKSKYAVRGKAGVRYSIGG